MFGVTQIEHQLLKVACGDAACDLRADVEEEPFLEYRFELVNEFFADT
jgi:hypothetical protein